MAKLYYGRDVKNEIDTTLVEVIDDVVHGVAADDTIPDFKLAVIEGAFAMASRIKFHFDEKEEEE